MLTPGSAAAGVLCAEPGSGSPSVPRKCQLFLPPEVRQIPRGAVALRGGFGWEKSPRSLSA